MRMTHVGPSACARMNAPHALPVLEIASEDDSYMESDVRVHYWAAESATAFLFGLYSLSLIELVFKHPVFPLNVFVCIGALAVGGAVRYRASRSFSAGVLVFLIVFAFGLLVSAYVLDTSYDGIRYHAAGIVAISDSYNFIYDATPHGELGRGYAKWVALYPKLTWVLGANFFMTTRLFETAKTGNWMGLLISFCFAYPLFRSLRTNRVRSYFLATLVAFNPVSVAQLFTTQQDGFLSSLLIGFACLLMLLIRAPAATSSIGVAMLAVLIVNTKTTGVVFVTIFLGSAFTWCISQRVSVRPCYIPLLSVLVGFFLFGYAPYTQSLIHTGNPFHGVIGRSAEPIVDGKLPANIMRRTPLILFVSSIFNRTTRVPADITFKIPGLVTPSEIREIHASSRFGGFGPLFSLALVLSTIALAIQMSQNALPRVSVAWLLLTLLASTLVHPAAWWARYVPQFFLFPLIAVAAWAPLRELSAVQRLLFRATLAVLAINVSLFSYTLGRDFFLSRQMSAQIAEICERSISRRLVIYDRECTNVKGPVLIRAKVHADSRTEFTSTGKVEELAGIVFSLE
jgi:hypothetical protein